MIRREPTSSWPAPLGLALLTGLALVATGCQRKSQTAAPKVVLESCRESGLEGDVTCGTYEVYEDRAARTGRKIALNIVVAKALAPSPQPDPLFVLAGGPGQAATEIAEQILPAFARVRRQRDVVFVDQRGTGKSNPLDCDPQRPDAGLAEQLEEIDQVAELKKCLAGYDADPRLYTTAIAMDDLDEVRDALGYPKINLWGGSYGTRAALVYLRQHGERARTAIIDGVAPVDLRLPLSFAKDGQRALDLLLAHCERDPACQKAFPQLRPELQALLARLQQQPVELTASHPLTGAPEPVKISHKQFTSNLRGLLYVPEAASLMPLTISRASAGDFAPYLAQATMLSGGFQKGMSVGMFFSIICAEDAPLVKEEDIAQQTAGTFLGDVFTREILEVCQIWPRGFLPEGYHQPVQSAVPTFILSGELDPVTPPAYGEATRQHLSNSRHLVVPGVGHGVTSQGCVPRLISEFIAQGSAEKLDLSCAESLQRPPFFITFAGPTR